jgi:hypothetical protein
MNQLVQQGVMIGQKGKRAEIRLSIAGSAT